MKRSVFLPILSVVTLLGPSIKSSDGDWARPFVVVVDGSEQDWRGSFSEDGGTSALREWVDVKPHQIGSIDILKAAYVLGPVYHTHEELNSAAPLRVLSPEDYPIKELIEAGVLHRDRKYPGRYTITQPDESWGIAMGFKFLGNVFESEDSYEISLDVFPRSKSGQRDSPWPNFTPDYRFTLSGKDHRIESEEYQFWNGEKWVGETQQDAPEIDAAAKGSFLEVLIPWSSIGSPFVGTDSIPTEDGLFLLWAIRAQHGEDQDLMPNPDLNEIFGGIYRDSYAGPYTGYFAVNINEVYYVSDVEMDSWGMVKAGFR